MTGAREAVCMALLLVPFSAAASELTMGVLLADDSPRLRILAGEAGGLHVGG